MNATRCSVLDDVCDRLDNSFVSKSWHHLRKYFYTRVDVTSRHDKVIMDAKLTSTFSHRIWNQLNSTKTRNINICQIRQPHLMRKQSSRNSATQTRMGIPKKRRRYRSPNQLRHIKDHDQVPSIFRSSGIVQRPSDLPNKTARWCSYSDGVTSG